MYHGIQFQRNRDTPTEFLAMYYIRAFFILALISRVDEGDAAFSDTIIA